MKGIPKFIFGEEGRHRVIPSPQISQISEKVGEIGKPGRFPPRSIELGAEYVERLMAARSRRRQTLLELIDKISLVGYRAEEVLKDMKSFFDFFPVQQGAVFYGLKVEVREGRDNAGRLRVYLRADGPEGESVFLLSGAASTEIRTKLTPVLGRAMTTEVIRHLAELTTQVDLIVRCRYLSVAFKLQPADGAQRLLDRWVSSARSYGMACAAELARRVQAFEDLDEELNQLVFEFNATIENVRYRSLVCSADVSAADPLGPKAPSFRVVTLINRATGKRATVAISRYKVRLKQMELRSRLTRSLGREPTETEFSEALSSMRKRSCSPWITRPLIEHCRLGRHSSGILDIQKRIAGVMEPWCEMRQLFQTLLGARGKK